jgi:hypothetical protein
MFLEKTIIRSKNFNILLYKWYLNQVEVISVKAAKVLWCIIITHLIYWPCLPKGKDIVFRFIMEL